MPLISYFPSAGGGGTAELKSATGGPYRPGESNTFSVSGLNFMPLVVVVYVNSTNYQGTVSFAYADAQGGYCVSHGSSDKTVALTSVDLHEGGFSITAPGMFGTGYSMYTWKAYYLD